MLSIILAVAVIVLVAVAAVLIPMISHESAGGSGQELPDSFVSETSATGADERTRTLSVTTEAGEPAELSQVWAGQTLVIEGSGFDAGIGIYVSVCAIAASAETKPQPCLGGVPDGAEAGDAAESVLSSAWVTDDWAWRAFATHRWEDADTGDFAVELTMPPAVDGELDCMQMQCAITTRADHTAGSDRVQDMQLPIRYTEESE